MYLHFKYLNLPFEEQPFFHRYEQAHDGKHPYDCIEWKSKLQIVQLSN